MEIQGRSYGRSLRPVNGARVELFDATNRRIAATVTNRKGWWMFRDVPEGLYRVRIELEGQVQWLPRV